MGIVKRWGENRAAAAGGRRFVPSAPTTEQDAQKDLRHLSRAELLELLLEETEENERLRAELAEMSRRLESRAIDLRNSGSIAEASLRINGVFEAAQKAAEQYLENIRLRQAGAGSPEALEAQTRARCEQMLRDARSQAESYLQSARLQAQQIAAQGSYGAEQPQSPRGRHAAHFKPSQEGDGRDIW